MPTPERSILLRSYMEQIAPTDRLPDEDLRSVQMGLFGEVGGIMAAAKKHHREGKAYAGYRRAVEEEFGDALWYLTALCRRLGYGVDDILSAAVEAYDKVLAASDLITGPIAHVSSTALLPPLDDTLLKLGDATAGVLGIREPSNETKALLIAFADRYLQALQSADVVFSKIVHLNLSKTRGRFLKADSAHLPTFDDRFAREERIPEKFEITIDQRKSGKCYLRMNDVFIGDPLTDNILDQDGYRFHDVFHFAHAAILHWSPVFRALIKQKRKSDPTVDEAQDGGRAIVVEEGLTAWLFARAKDLDYFKGQDTISYDLLKTVQQFVAGYEVQDCPLNLWETAILQGFEVFRKVRDNFGGVVVGDRNARTLEYKPLAETTS